MMATIMNARVLQDALRSIGVKANALAPHVSFTSQSLCGFSWDWFVREGEVVICGGGNGNPYFTTDSAAALRALELNCDV